VQVVHPGGEVIKPESWRCVNDEGMPVHGRPYEKGNLYIRFHLQFPDELDAATMDELRKLLPPGAAPAAANGRMETDELEQARPLLASMVSLTSVYQRTFIQVVGLATMDALGKQLPLGVPPPGRQLPYGEHRA